MKKVVFLFIAIIFISLQTKAQDSTKTKVKELGIGLSNFNSFSLQYRWGNTKTLYRISGNIGFSTSLPQKNNLSVNTTPVNLNSGLAFSILKLKPIGQKIYFMYGGIVGFSYSIIENKSTNETYIGSINIEKEISTNIQQNQSLRPYIGAVIGAAVQINEHFFVYLEIAPNIYYSGSFKTTKLSSDYYDYTGAIYQHFPGGANITSAHEFGIANLANSNAMLTFVYRITK